MQTLKPSQSWAIAQPTAPLAAQQDQDVSDAERVAPRVPQPISVIIPTLNEAANIAQILVRLNRTLTEAAILYEVIVVDDHSTDNTVLIAEAIARGWSLPVRVLTKQGQPGFGAGQVDPGPLAGPVSVPDRGQNAECHRVRPKVVHV